MEYVPASKITNAHIHMIEKSLEAAPKYERISIEVIMALLSKKEAMLFSVPRGIVVVSVMDGAYEKRLLIRCFYCTHYGAHYRGIIKDLKRLAAEWKCANIETCVYQRPLLQIILKTGGRVESVNLIMAVETDNGQQEKVDYHLQSNHDGGAT